MRVTVFLYDDFNLPDLLGPVGVFGARPDDFNIVYTSWKGDIINSTQGMKILTDPLDAVSHSDVLIIPGGKGSRHLLNEQEEVRELLKKAASHSDICLTVANGSGLLAQTGLLYRRNIADYAEDANWKRMFTAAVNWIPDEKWVSDGKFYSCAQSMSAVDMALNVLADLTDLDAACRTAEQLGHAWNPDDSLVF